MIKKDVDMVKFFKIYKTDEYKIIEIFGLKFKFSLPQYYTPLQKQHVKEILKYLKIMTYIKDDIFKIYYYDKEIKFYLPHVNFECIQSFILESSSFFEVKNLEKVRKYINPNTVVLDAGANIGNHTLYFAKVCNAKKVYAFEPLNLVFDVLKRNIEINNLENVELHHTALSDKDSMASIQIYYKDNLGGTRFEDDSSGNYKMVTLDEINLEQLDFCKIDVEGHQLELLKGAKNTLEKFKPMIWIEMLYNSKDYPDCDDLHENIEPKKLLEEYGYVLKEQLTDIDYLYVHKDKA